MQGVLPGNSRSRMMVPPIPLGKLIGRGMVGGLVATTMMDLVMIGIFVAAGKPPSTCFSIVGDTVAHLIAYQNPSANVALGVTAHYLIGPLLGALFGVILRFFPALRVNSWKKAILYAVLYAEVASQPMLILTPIFLRMTASETLAWFGGAFGMHLIWGCVFGTVWGMAIPRSVPVSR